MVGIDHPFKVSSFSKVKNIPNLIARYCEIIDQLSDILFNNMMLGFQFEDNLVLNDNIRQEVTKINPLIPYRQQLLTLGMQLLLFQFIHKRPLIHLLFQPIRQISVDFKESRQHFFRFFLIQQHRQNINIGIG